MRAGDIIFVRGTSLLSRIIRFFDKGRYSHVAIAVSDTEILEAQYFTRSRIVKNYHEDYDIFDIGLSELQRSQVAWMSKNMTGKWYDYKQILGYIFKRPWDNPNNMICSELVAVMLNELCILRPSHNITIGDFRMMKPNELYRYLAEFVKNQKFY